MKYLLPIKMRKGNNHAAISGDAETEEKHR